MKQITGRYATAIVYTDIIEETAIEQIKMLCEQSFVEGCHIRIMPDAHAGTGCVIGFTADLGQRVIPSIVGWIPSILSRPSTTTSTMRPISFARAQYLPSWVSSC